MRQFAYNLVYGNWWVALGAALLLQMTIRECGGEGLHLIMSGFVLGATVTGYCINMLSGLSELRKSDTRSVRHHWCMTHEEWLRAHLGAGAVITIATFLLLPRQVLYVLVPSAVITLLYVSPLLKGVRLREIGPVKIIWVATVWSAVTVVLPWSVAINDCGIGHLASMTVERWLFIFAICLPFDIRDMRNDRAKGIRTLPLILGIQRAKVIACVAIITSMLLTFHRYDWDVTPVTLAYSFALLLTSALIVRSSDGRHEMYYSFWMEGTMILLALAVMLANAL